jgi:hypothetical protein
MKILNNEDLNVTHWEVAKNIYLQPSWSKHKGWQEIYIPALRHMTLIRFPISSKHREKSLMGIRICSNNTYAIKKNKIKLG